MHVGSNLQTQQKPKQWGRVRKERSLEATLYFIRSWSFSWSSTETVYVNNFMYQALNRQNSNFNIKIHYRSETFLHYYKRAARQTTSAVALCLLNKCLSLFFIRKTLTHSFTTAVSHLLFSHC